MAGVAAASPTPTTATSSPRACSERSRRPSCTRRRTLRGGLLLRTAADDPLIHALACVFGEDHGEGVAGRRRRGRGRRAATADDRTRPRPLWTTTATPCSRSWTARAGTWARPGGRRRARPLSSGGRRAARVRLWATDVAGDRRDLPRRGLAPVNLLHDLASPPGSPLASSRIERLPGYGRRRRAAGPARGGADRGDLPFGDQPCPRGSRPARLFPGLVVAITSREHCWRAPPASGGARPLDVADIVLDTARPSAT